MSVSRRCLRSFEGFKACKELQRSSRDDEHFSANTMSWFERLQNRVLKSAKSAKCGEDPSQAVVCARSCKMFENYTRAERFSHWLKNAGEIHLVYSLFSSPDLPHFCCMCELHRDSSFILAAGSRCCGDMLFCSWLAGREVQHVDEGTLESRS